MNNTFTYKKAQTLEVLLFGFDRDIFNILAPPPDDDDKFFYFNRFNHQFEIEKWVQQIDVDAKLPYAIVCNFDFLLQNEYSFLKSINNCTFLRHIPVIVLSEKETGIAPSTAIKKGIDDCYVGSVSWRDVNKRIKFLREYKSSLYNQIPIVETDGFEFNIPFGKRVFDIVFSLIILTAIFPVLLLIAALIKLESKGPVLYFSKRVGSGYQVFKFWKFRSMCANADERLSELQYLNQYSGNNEEAVFVKLENDPRVTNVGRFIRKTSLDELPQLFNVLRGEMSIVGNRPLPLYEAQQMTRDEWVKRFWAPAGITGLWQTCGRGKDNLTVQERVGLDIKYAECFSFQMDARILSRTLPAMIQKG